MTIASTPFRGIAHLVGASDGIRHVASSRTTEQARLNFMRVKAQLAPVLC